MKKTILAMVATMFVAAQAYAVSGTITFNGSMSQSTTKGTTTNKFANPWKVTAGQQTGDYSGVPDGFTPVTMSNFSFTGNNTPTPVLLGGPIVQWSFVFGAVTYNFSLEALTSAVSASGFIAETGTGTACIGTDCSPATWSLSGTGRSFTFSASVQTTAVPDGGSAVALLGIALAGIEAGRRLIRARKA
jgi:VPDSG-CTERM motif